ncbi:MAG TPA: hypothetical protein VGD17_10045, partial [Chitinophagaceae bacterium]
MKIFIILAFIWGNAFNALSQNDSITTKIFSIAELQADLDTLYKWVNETHPSLYTAVNRQQADAFWKTVKRSINRPMTRMEFSRIAVPLLTQYKDGHMGLTPEFDLPEFVQYKKEGGKLFPLKVMIKKNRIWCVANYLQNGVVVPGDEILAINGKSAEHIVQELLPVWPADDDASNEVIVSRLFSFSLWFHYGWGFESAVTVKKTNGKVSVGLKGLAADEYLEKYFSGNKTWNLDLYPDHNLAVITSGAYNASSEKSRRFLDSAFAVIKSSGVQHLAFDIRNNGGGNST